MKAACVRFQVDNNFQCWKKLSLPEAGHLNGLRDFPSEYKPAVEDFLNQFSH